MKQRVVVDTSTLVSAAFRTDSKPRLALRIAIEHFELCLSDELLAELKMVLSRPQFAKYAPAEALEAFIESVRREGQMFSMSAADVKNVKPSCRDPEDNHILALALAASADIVVSSDQDLVVLHPWRGISILTPAQFLSQFPI